MNIRQIGFAASRLSRHSAGILTVANIVRQYSNTAGLAAFLDTTDITEKQKNVVLKLFEERLADVNEFHDKRLQHVNKLNDEMTQHLIEEKDKQIQRLESEYRKQIRNLLESRWVFCYPFLF